jgi:hypothetical protein
MHIHWFQPNDQAMAILIHGTIYCNVPIFGILVHLGMENNSSNASFQVYYVEKIFSIV